MKRMFQTSWTTTTNEKERTTQFWRSYRQFRALIGQENGEEEEEEEEGKICNINCKKVKEEVAENAREISPTFSAVF